MSTRATYDRDALIGALRAAGVREGDTLFSHVGVGLLGYPREGRDERTAWCVVRDALLATVGEGGTLLVPTYSYTYMKPGEVFDPARTPSDVGAFTEYFRGLPAVRRSLDPIFSVAALGPLAQELIAELPHDCFGADCVYARLTRVGAKLCNLGVGFRYATYVHHAEQMLGVPYRFPKHFRGLTRIADREREETWLYNVRALEDPAGDPDLRRLESEVKVRGLLGVAAVGMGQVTCIALSDLYAVCAESVRRDPWFMARGGAVDYKGGRIDQTGRVEFARAIPSVEDA